MAEKDGSGGEKLKPDSVISEQEREWAQHALAEFSKGNYGACLQHLSKLEAARPQDTKVLYNKAVAEYYRSELKKTDQFRKNMNVVCAQAHVSVEEVDSLEDVEHCVIYYSQAVILFHMQQHSSALGIINKVFSFIEPMEESLAHRVCLLLIELHLRAFQPGKALTLIQYIENQFVLTEGSSLGADKDIKPLEKEGKEKKVPACVDAATEAFRVKLLKYRARCYLMTHALKACKKELKSVIASGGLTISSVFLKANLEYQKGSYEKAIKVLNSMPQNVPSFKDAGESPAVLFYNDMGCIHHYMAKPHLACFYLGKALQENDAAVRSLPRPDPSEPISGRPLHTLGANRSHEVLYNLGVCLLHAGRPAQAFDCLTEAVQVFHVNPRLWLRLAECCIMVHKQSNKPHFEVKERKKELVRSVVGSGPHRKVVLSPCLSQDTRYSCEGQSYAVPVATLEFATLCLRNALLLLPEEGGLPAAPSNPLGPREVAMLRCSALADSAYVGLCLGDYVTALGHARTLLVQPDLPGTHRMLGHMYAAEALILMDKISEAVEHLNPDNVQDLSLVPPVSDVREADHEGEERKPLRGWFPSSVPTARATMQYNLSVAFAIRGELDKAGETLKQVWISKNQMCDIPVHVIMLALYIELQLGEWVVNYNIHVLHIYFVVNITPVLGAQ
ncbi:CCR4-NOT transcription complex subunit 10 isoform X2 [Bacillus rossius redtenbacheri]